MRIITPSPFLCLFANPFTKEQITSGKIGNNLISTSQEKNINTNYKDKLTS